MLGEQQLQLPKRKDIGDPKSPRGESRLREWLVNIVEKECPDRGWGETPKDYLDSWHFERRLASLARNLQDAAVGKGHWAIVSGLGVCARRAEESMKWWKQGVRNRRKELHLEKLTAFTPDASNGNRFLEGKFSLKELKAEVKAVKSNCHTLTIAPDYFPQGTEFALQELVNTGNLPNKHLKPIPETREWAKMILRKYYLWNGG